MSFSCPRLFVITIPTLRSWIQHSRNVDARKSWCSKTTHVSASASGPGATVMTMSMSPFKTWRSRPPPLFPLRTTSPGSPTSVWYVPLINCASALPTPSTFTASLPQWSSRSLCPSLMGASARLALGWKKTTLVSPFDTAAVTVAETMVLRSRTIGWWSKWRASLSSISAVRRELVIKFFMHLSSTLADVPSLISASPITCNSPRLFCKRVSGTLATLAQQKYAVPILSRWTSICSSTLVEVTAPVLNRQE